MFGVAEREQVLEVLGRLGYVQGKPEPERGLDAVFRPKQRALGELPIFPKVGGLRPSVDALSNMAVLDAGDDA